MKTLLLIIAFVLSSLAAPKCFESYEKAAYTVEKKHIKIQADYVKQNIRYLYEFEPITMFPFLFSKNTNLKKYLALNTRIVYLCDCENAIGNFKDNLGILHVQIVILSYTQSGRSLPKERTYTMYFLKQNEDQTWKEEKDPEVVVMRLVYKESGIYNGK